jgi:hypothetical protein
MDDGKESSGGIEGGRCSSFIRGVANFSPLLLAPLSWWW